MLIRRTAELLTAADDGMKISAEEPVLDLAANYATGNRPQTPWKRLARRSTQPKPRNRHSRRAKTTPTVTLSARCPILRTTARTPHPARPDPSGLLSSLAFRQTPQTRQRSAAELHTTHGTRTGLALLTTLSSVRCGRPHPGNRPSRPAPCFTATAPGETSHTNPDTRNDKPVTTRQVDPKHTLPLTIYPVSNT